MKMMQTIGHPIMLNKLLLKVLEITQERQTPFKNGIFRWGWFRWFKNCKFYLSFLITHGLEVVCVKGLCLVNVELFYTNLEQTLLQNVGAVH
jgi:hypothetical protein